MSVFALGFSSQAKIKISYLTFCHLTAKKCVIFSFKVRAGFEFISENRT